MGLSAYGKPLYLDLFREIIKVRNGQPFLNFDYFYRTGENRGAFFDSRSLTFSSSTHLKAKVQEFLGPPRNSADILTDRHMNIASSLQHRFQEVYLDLVRNLRERSSRNTCVIAGGCALNSVANGLLEDLNLFDKYIFHPACSDDGLAVGSALYTSRVELNETPSSRTTPFSPYLGTSYTDDELTSLTG